jgi:DNA-binding transcriptional ArsR family regulator
MNLFHPDPEAIELSSVLAALSDPHRLCIVRQLAGTEDAFPCGGFDLGITKSTLTHHFRVLREAGVIRQQLVGTSKLNWLRREDLDTRFPGLLDAILASERGPAELSAAPGSSGSAA